ncbi:MAG: hypothetical protein J5910_02440 [Lachnospiraceae bacterium]|nr:hypothetical protein [Lachnospiraceae bacterium]
MDEIGKEKIESAIDLLLAMVTEEVAERENREPELVLHDILASNTAKILYDEDSKLWWDGPSAVADLYIKEKQLSMKKTTE